MKRPIRVGVLGDRVGGSWDSPSCVLRLIYPWSSCADIDMVRLEGLSTPALLPGLNLDAIVFQRLQGATVLGAELLTAAVEFGIPCVLDIDDDFLAVAGDRSHEQSGAVAECIDRYRATLSHFDEVWASTPALGARLEAVGCSVRVRATLPPDWAHPRSVPRRDGGPLTVVYFGTSTHQRDWQMIEPVVRRLVRQGTIQFTLVGIDAGAVAEHGFRSIPVDSRVVSRYTAFMDWLVRIGPFDVGVGPLMNTPLNRAKSSLKFLEYGQMGVVPLVSRIETYALVGEMGFEHLMVEGRPQAWTDALTRLSELSCHDLAVEAEAVQRAVDEHVTRAHGERERGDLASLVRLRASGLDDAD